MSSSFTTPKFKFCKTYLCMSTLSQGLQLMKLEVAVISNLPEDRGTMWNSSSSSGEAASTSSGMLNRHFLTSSPPTAVTSSSNSCLDSVSYNTEKNNKIMFKNTVLLNHSA